MEKNLNLCVFIWNLVGSKTKLSHNEILEKWVFCEGIDFKKTYTSEIWKLKEMIDPKKCLDIYSKMNELNPPASIFDIYDLNSISTGSYWYWFSVSTPNCP